MPPQNPQAASIVAILVILHANALKTAAETEMGAPELDLSGAPEIGQSGASETGRMEDALEVEVAETDPMAAEVLGQCFAAMGLALAAMDIAIARCLDPIQSVTFFKIL